MFVVLGVEEDIVKYRYGVCFYSIGWLFKFSNNVWGYYVDFYKFWYSLIIIVCVVLICILYLDIGNYCMLLFNYGILFNYIICLLYKLDLIFMGIYFYVI